MKRAVQAAAVLAWALSLQAQITSTLNRRPNGLDEVQIRNDSKMNLTAYVVTARQATTANGSSRAPFVVFSDPLVDVLATALGPGQERVVMTRGIGFSSPAQALRPSPMMNHVLAEPIVSAGVFDDGTTTGDEVLLTRLLLRRSSMLLAVETSLETLSRAGQRNVPREQLIGEFDRLAAALNHWYLSPEQTVGRDLYQTLAGRLRDLPEPALGEAFPPTVFITQQTAWLNRQRVELLDSKPSLADGVLVSAR